MPIPIGAVKSTKGGSLKIAKAAFSTYFLDPPSEPTEALVSKMLGDSRRKSEEASIR